MTTRFVTEPPPPQKSGLQTLHTYNNPGGQIRWSGGGDGGPGPCGADETGAHQGGADETGAHQGGADGGEDLHGRANRAGALQGGAETHVRDWDLEETETQETSRAYMAQRTEAGTSGSHGRSGASGCHDGFRGLRGPWQVRGFCEQWRVAPPQNVLGEIRFLRGVLWRRERQGADSASSWDGAGSG